ncbi:MAG: hypothetical protein AB8B55_20185 [Mariniblastus sp.]
MIDPNKQTLEEQIIAQRQDRIEKLRHSNGAKHIIIGIFAILVGLGLFFLINNFNEGRNRFSINGRRRIGALLHLLYWSSGRWWVPLLCFLYAAWQLLIGIGSCLKLVDIDDEEAIPDGDKCTSPISVR